MLSTLVSVCYNANVTTKLQTLIHEEMDGSDHPFIKKFQYQIRYFIQEQGWETLTVSGPCLGHCDSHILVVTCD